MYYKFYKITNLLKINIYELIHKNCFYKIDCIKVLRLADNVCTVLYKVYRYTKFGYLVSTCFQETIFFSETLESDWICEINFVLFWLMYTGILNLVT